MTRIDFEFEYEKLVKWFRMKMTKENADIAYNKIKFYPVKGLEYAVDFLIENGKPTPGQFPTVNEIINLIMTWLDANPEEKFKRTEFDPVEDFSYPIGKLIDGYKVLASQGEKAFRIFAKNNRMPKNDQDRVIMKHKVILYREGKVPNLTNGIGKTV
jgi:hypothetical protein